MNIHPAFVHFPIALLILYTLIEMLPLHLWIKAVEWTPIRNFLLYVGTLGMIPTIATGLIAARGIGEAPLIEMHEHFAFGLFGVFVLSCLVTFYAHKKGRDTKIEIVLKILALLGFLGLFTVGALGAAIVYGYSVDPIVYFITGLLGLH